jgi:hypothetical protein
MLKWATLMSRSTTHSASAGTAISTPTVAMILEASLAWLSFRNTKRSSTSPSKGAKTTITTRAAHALGQCRPFCSSKYM